MGEKGSFVVPELAVEDEEEGFGREYATEGKKRKKLVKEGAGSSGKERKKVSKGEKKYGISVGEEESHSKSGLMKKGMYSEKLAGKEDGEVKEMWDTIAGGDSEDDQEGHRNVEDDNFIDDSALDPADRYVSDNEPRCPGDAPQAEEGEEDDEIKQLFKMGKKKKKNEKSPAEIALLVENVMAELEVTAEEDAELNRRGKPAINKLKKSPLLTEFPIDLEQYDRREQLKKSGLAKVIMFLSKSDEETRSNRKLAKDLVDKWSRPIFDKSTRFEDMRNINDDRAFRRPTIRRPVNNSTLMECTDGDLDLDISRKRRSGQSSLRQRASRPQATPLDFVVRPQSKIDPEEIRARAKQVLRTQERKRKLKRKLCIT
ncbi:hypothetical protein JCGZ_22441 [Jatropha curcas]|uniref:TFIIS N-terminal domain-containing protein n=1 Tax=Jatropha curcas TaxID=180498 RepID=A0A067JQW9_JATCU|nr:hypothetical protein JCGZ_22441 [Jatropha curcas]